MSGLGLFKSVNPEMDYPENVRKIMKTYNYVREYNIYSTYIEKLKRFHNKHEGERCILIGTGPSLQKTDFSLIRNEILYGVNTFFKGLEKYNVKCRYWTVIDRDVFNKHYESLLNIDTTFFLSGTAVRDYISNKEKYQKNAKNEPILIRNYDGIRNYNHKDWGDIRKGLYSAGNVMPRCLQIAYYLGFKEVYLIGCDCSYSGGRHHHFDGEKYDFQYNGTEGKEFLKEEKQHWSKVFNSYRICKKAYEKDNRKIYNATPGGELEVFERKKLEEVF